jgi:PAS domain-containing protein
MFSNASLNGSSENDEQIAEGDVSELRSQTEFSMLSDASEPKFSSFSFQHSAHLSPTNSLRPRRTSIPSNNPLVSTPRGRSGSGSQLPTGFSGQFELNSSMMSMMSEDIDYKQQAPSPSALSQLASPANDSMISKLRILFNIQSKDPRVILLQVQNQISRIESAMQSQPQKSQLFVPHQQDTNQLQQLAHEPQVPSRYGILPLPAGPSPSPQIQVPQRAAAAQVQSGGTGGGGICPAEFGSVPVDHVDFEEVFNVAPIPFAIMHASGLFLSCNQEWSSMVEVPRNQVANVSITTLCANTDSLMTMLGALEHFARGEVRSRTMDIRLKKQQSMESMHIQLTITAVDDHNPARNFLPERLRPSEAESLSPSDRRNSQGGAGNASSGTEKLSEVQEFASAFNASQNVGLSPEDQTSADRPLLCTAMILSDH